MSLPKGMANRVFGRDGWKCRHCRNRNGLHPHHVIHRGGKNGPNAMNNLITVCWQCHRAHHDGKLDIEIVETLENDVIVKFMPVDRWQPE